MTLIKGRNTRHWTDQMSVHSKHTDENVPRPALRNRFLGLLIDTHDHFCLLILDDLRCFALSEVVSGVHYKTESEKVRRSMHRAVPPQCVRLNRTGREEECSEPFPTKVCH